MHFFFFLMSLSWGGGSAHWLWCKLLEILWHGDQEHLDFSVNVPITGWEGTRWQTNEGWTNLLNDTTWNATFKIPSGLTSPADMECETWHIFIHLLMEHAGMFNRAGDMDAQPADLLTLQLRFDSAHCPFQAAAFSLLILVGCLYLAPCECCAPLGWDYLSFLVMAFRLCDWDWGLGFHLFTGSIDCKIILMLGMYLQKDPANVQFT